MAPNLLKRPHLAREIAVVLAVKFLALSIIWNVWFAEPEARRLDGERIGAAIYSSGDAVQAGRELHAGP